MNNFTGKFQITSWDEKSYIENDDGSKQSYAQITQSYQGDITGTSELKYLMSYAANGTAIFIGFETITGIIAGKSGSFVIQHNGKFEQSGASADFTIVCDSGKNELSGISGSGTFASAENGQANYQLAVSFE